VDTARNSSVTGQKIVVGKSLPWFGIVVIMQSNIIADSGLSPV